ncbi:ABC transporter permease [Actinospica robiniae]|uniref:ABC transporter permease n=1 Tax=Actinospica robiniae TaxID=304901 RepID=UPI0003F6397A|nr:ABC transporter permease [Actinospica robiniae]
MNGSWFSSWRAALRISRREITRHRARNTLIVVMLGLPVFAAVAVDTLLTTGMKLTSAEVLDRTVGGTDAYIEMPQSNPIYQSLDAKPHIVPAPPTGAAAPVQPGVTPYATQIQNALPQASVLPVTESFGAFFHGPDGYANAQYWRTDVGDPRLSGAYDLLSGRRPASADEVDVSPAAAKALGASAGSTVTLAIQSAANGKSSSFTVVGIMQQPDDTNAAAIFGLTGAPAANGDFPEGWYIENPGGVSWSQVEALDGRGFPVVSREVLADPPAQSQDPYYAAAQLEPPGPVSSSAAAAAAVSAIVIGIALLEVVLLAGPAFAVSARRREREYAIIGAAGADDKQVRRIVLADGVMLGLVAGVLGTAVGLGTACAVLPFFARLTGKLPGAVHVSILQVLGVALLAVLLGLCSALQPARSVSRREIMATLSGRRAALAHKRRVGAVVRGVLMIVVGAFVEFSASHGTGALTQLGIVGGTALIEVGGILCTPAIVSLVAKLGGVLPLGPRLALRDCARNLGRTTPAVAAIFAAVAGAVAAGGYLQSSITQQRQAYQPFLLTNQIAMQVTGSAQATQVEQALRSIMPVTGSFVTESISGYQQSINAPDQWVLSVLTPGTSASCAKDSVSTVPKSSVEDFECGQYIEPFAANGELVGGAQVLTDVTGVKNDAADAMLDQGGIVLFDSASDFAGAVRDGHVSLVTVTDVPGKAGTDIQTVHQYSLPALVVSARGIPSPGAVISPAAAEQLGLVGRAQRTVLNVDMPGPVTADQQIAASQVAARFGISTGADVDQGLPDTSNVINLVVLAVALLLALAAAGIATGLALADGRADHETLSSVGSSPWTRRWLAGSTALVITGLGVLIGVPIGFLIAKGLLNVDTIGVSAANPVRFIVPWLNLGAMAVATPLLTALGAMLLSRSTGAASGRTS